MATVGTLISFTANTVIRSADVNSNFTALRSAFNNSAVLTDTSTTITVSHTWSVNQAFAGGITVASGQSIVASGVTITGKPTLSGGMTITSGTTITASGVTIAGGLVGGLTIATGTLTVSAASILSGNVTCGAALNVVGALVVTGAGTITGNLTVSGSQTVVGSITCSSITVSNSFGAATFTATSTMTASSGYIATNGLYSASGTSMTLSVGGNTVVQATLAGYVNFNLPTRIVGGVGVVCASVTLATTSTVGFIYMPTTSGTPTGIPHAEAGTVPMVYDVINANLWIYRDAAWHGTPI